MRPTARGRGTESAFVEAARRVFTEKGYLNARISDIAAEAGKSTAAFYRYYENKEALLEALVNEYAVELDEQTKVVTYHKDPYKNILQIVELWWTTYKKYLPVIIGMFHLSMTDPAIAEQRRQFKANGIRGIERGMAEAKRQGRLRGVDTELLASAISSMMEYFSWVWLAGGGEAEIEPPDDDEAIRTLATVWYRSVYCAEPQPAPAARRTRTASTERTRGRAR
ncbi:TetR/AcrR family transcriptional regulator [Mycolicibacterium novocastrense]|uniref:TetR/AcrR family transcriptional regulator n=1 Tax=Mycolicibacterium novocastrense TaxID=59813 RepID=UPI0009EAECBC|nr:TetR/AcrR family transcriptional regulator [Mycolicibacterium novocastrense]